MKARLEFAEIFVDKSESFWDNVLWTGETRLDLFGEPYQLYIHREKNEAFEEKKPTVKQGRGGEMCFRAILMHLEQLTLESVHHHVHWLDTHTSSNRIITQN